MPHSILGHLVETSIAVESLAGEGIAVGLAGKVVWDEGGPEVVVQFEQAVSNRGFPVDNNQQAWVPRHCLVSRDAKPATASTRLPYDEGCAAYTRRQLPSTNPYPNKDWRHDEWYLGWSAGEQSDTWQAYDWASDSFSPQPE